MTIDPGFDPSNVLTARVSFPRAAYDAPRTLHALEQLATRLQSVLPPLPPRARSTSCRLIPGEAIVMFTNPLQGDARGPESMIRARLRVVSPGFVEAMGVRLKSGRTFTWNDTRAAQPVLIVNDAFVREHLEGRDPLATRLPGALEGRERDWQIIGVVSDLRQASLDAAPMPEVWVSWTQLHQNLGMPGSTATLTLRTKGDPLAIAGVLRDLLREIDPALALADVTTMERRVSASVAQPRFAAALLGALALLALLSSRPGSTECWRTAWPSASARSACVPPSGRRRGTSCASSSARRSG